MRFIPLLLLTLAGLTRAADESTNPNYFPLTPGVTWKYQVNIKENNDPAKTTEQTVTVEAVPKPGGQKILVAADIAYATRPDGVYVIGQKHADDIELFDEPQKVVPAKPQVGDKWNYRDSFGQTSATVLATEKLKLPAGEFEAVKIYFFSAGGPNGADRREVYQWFAPNVGPVKGTISQRLNKPDGTVSTRDITMELAAWQTPKPDILTPDPKPQAPTVETLFSQAEALAKKGDHASAIAKYDSAIAKDPKAPKLHAYKAVSQMALRQYDLAEKELTTAVSLNDKEFTYHELLGQLKIATGNLKEGKSHYDQAIALAPASAGNIYLDLAAALSAAKNPNWSEEIEAALNKAVASDPPCLEALFILGQSYVNAGRKGGREYLAKYVTESEKLPADKQDLQKVKLARQLIRAIDIVKGAP